MRRVIGMDIHRTFAEVVFWEEGKLRPAGRIGMTRAGLEGFGRSLGKEDEVVIEATGNAMAVVRVLAPYVARVIVANPLQVKAIAHSHVKTDKIDAGVLASLRAANFLPEIWLPDADTERMRRLVARRNQVVRHRTRIKNEVHAILHAHLIPPCPHADMFGRLGRIWLARQIVPDDERAAIERHLGELDRLLEDLGVLDREIAQAAIEDPTVKRLLTITGVNLIVAAGLAAAIGDVRRFPDPQSLVSYVGLNPRVRQSGLGLAQHGRISKRGRSHARAMLVAFAHPTMHASPDENIDWLFGALPAGKSWTFDTVSHSRGGLVVRALAAHGAANNSCKISRMVMVAPPNFGTPLSDAEHWTTFLNAHTNLLVTSPDTVSTIVAEGALCLVKILGTGVARNLPGVAAMNLSGDYLPSLAHRTIANPDGIFVVAANYTPTNRDVLKQLMLSAADAAVSRFFDEANDLVVPTLGCSEGPITAAGFPIAADRLVKLSGATHHCNLFENPTVKRQLSAWLDITGAAQDAGLLSKSRTRSLRVGSRRKPRGCAGKPPVGGFRPGKLDA